MAPALCNQSFCRLNIKTLAKCRHPFKGKRYGLARQMHNYWKNSALMGDSNSLELMVSPYPNVRRIFLIDPCKGIILETRYRKNTGQG